MNLTGFELRDKIDEFSEYLDKGMEDCSDGAEIWRDIRDEFNEKFDNKVVLNDFAKQTLLNSLKSINRASNHDFANKISNMMSKYNYIIVFLKDKSQEQRDKAWDSTREYVLSMLNIYTIIEEKNVRITDLIDYFKFTNLKYLNAVSNSGARYLDDIQKHITMFLVRMFYETYIEDPFNADISFDENDVLKITLSSSQMVLDKNKKFFETINKKFSFGLKTIEDIVYGYENFFLNYEILENKIIISLFYKKNS